jgi:NodT family efflux transporter outer membrane factor (OMF) lipoprotein
MERRALALLLALAACASPGPRTPPTPPIEVATLAGVGPAPVVLESRWWSAFKDPQLDALVEHALADHPTLATARAREAGARAALEVAGAALEPRLAASAMLTRERYSATGLFPPPIAGATLNEGQVGLNLNYEVDLAGERRSARDAAELRARAAGLESAAASIRIVHALIASYLALDHDERLAALLDALAGSRARRLELALRRERAGLDTDTEADAARTALALAAAELVAVRADRERLSIAVAVLSGQGPLATIGAPALAGLEPALPERLPADLVARRPDVAAARLRVEAARAGIHVAEAAFYPNLNLAAFAGVDSLDLGRFLRAPNRVWGVAPALTLPIFTGGRLRGELHGAESTYAEAVGDYDAKVLEAFRDVAEQVALLRALEPEARARHEALASAEHALENATRRLRGGLGDERAVCDSEETRIALARAIADLEARRLALTVNLARALGGGYAPPGPADLESIHGH